MCGLCGCGAGEERRGEARDLCAGADLEMSGESVCVCVCVSVRACACAYMPHGDKRSLRMRMRMRMGVHASVRVGMCVWMNAKQSKPSTFSQSPHQTDIALIDGSDEG